MQRSSPRFASPWRFPLAATVALATLIGLAGCQTDNGATVAGPAPGPAEGRGDATLAGGREQGQQGGKSVAFPTGASATSAVVMKVAAPEQVRAGEPFQYRLSLTNTTETPLSNVRVRRIAPEAAGNDGRARTASASASPDREKGAAEAGAATRRDDGSAARPTGRDEWEVGMLMPGETKTVTAEAVAEEVGQFESCLAVTYQPAVCVTTRVVQPALRLTKQGPSDVLICEPITYTYAVTNTGSGVARGVTVRDELPEGLATAQGQRAIALNVGDIPAGQTKQVQARVQAQQTGEFASRAIAASEGAKAQSGQVTTVVREPELAMEVNAPEWEYLGQSITYRVSVTNTGDGPARDTRLVFEAPEYVGEIRPRDLGVLEPEQTRTFNVTLPARRPGQVRLAAAAEAFCAERTTGEAVTDVRTIAALRLEMVDNKDPVRVGENTTYQVIVRNQGFGPAENVTLNATLPEGLAFVGAQGETDVKAQGQKLTFAPVKSLAPGAAATWWVEARAQQPGMTQFRIELNAESLDQPAVEFEPTRLYQP
jgi:uncharacterized repeat protein (TIGR01451 family)